MTDKNIYRRKEPQNDEQDTEYQGTDRDGDSPLDNEMERVIGKEVNDKPEPVNRQPQVRVVYRDRPAAPRGPGPATFVERPLPAHLMGGRVPELTNADKMMRKAAMPGAMSLFPKASSSTSMILPKAKAMSFNIPMPMGQRGSRLDPFKGLAGFGKKRPLPKGMQPFPQAKGKRRKFL